MAVSQAELRLLITAQDRTQQILASVTASVDKATASVNSLGRSQGFRQATDGVTLFGKEVKNLEGLAPFEKAILQAKQFGQAAQQAAQQAQAAQAMASGAGGGGRGGGGGSTVPTPNIPNPGSSLSGIQQAFQQAQQQAAQASGAITQSLMAIGNAARGVAGGVTGGLSAAFNGLQSLVGGITGIAGQIASLGRAGQDLGAASQGINTFGSSLRNMVALGASIVGVQSAVSLLQRGFAAVGDAAIGFNSQLENATIAFTSLLGSGEKARAFIGQLQDFAARTSFDFPGLLHMSQMLVGVGLKAEQVIPLLRDVAGAMTAAGRTSADVQGVGLALQQVFTAGKVNAQDMNQLIQRGIPAWAIMAEAIQKTGEPIETAIARVRKLGEQGKITSQDFFAAFEQYASNHSLADIAEKSVASFSGALSNLGDGFRNLVSSAAEPAFTRISAGIQTLAVALTSDPAKQFGLDLQATLEDAIRSFGPFQQALANVFQGFQTGGVKGALDSIMTQFQGLAAGMQDAGAQLMVTYAQGIMQGAADAIQGAVNFVADLIASFLIGNSPPPSGPLAQIDQGGKNVGLAWVQGLSEGFQGVEQVLIPVTDAFGNVGKSLSLTDVGSALQGAQGNLKGLQAAAEEADGALRSLNEAQREIDQQQGSLNNQVDSIKSAYSDQVSALQDAIAAVRDQNTEAEKYAELIQRQNDAITRQADLRDKAALSELQAAQIAAEGDPVAKAALIKQQSLLKAQEQELQLRQRGQDLDRQEKQAGEAQVKYQEQLAKWEKDREAARKAGKDFTTARPTAPDPKDQQLAREKLGLDRQELQLQQQLNGLTDKQKLAEIEAQRSIIERNQALRRVDEDRARASTDAIKNAAEIERAQKEIAALPMEQQLAAIKKEEEAQLAPLQKRLEALQAEERQLGSIRAQWQGIKADIADATQAQKAVEAAQKKSDKESATGQSGLFPNGRPALREQPIDVAAAAEKVGHSFSAAIGKSIQANAGPEIFGVLGAVLGGMAFGPLGLAAGAAFGAQVGAGVQSRVPDLLGIIQDAGRTFVEGFTGIWSTDHGDTWVSPLVDAAGRLGIAFRVAADIIGATWNALKGPVGAVMTFIEQHSGLAAAALTGLLIPAFSGLLSIVGTVLSPIIGLLAPLTPAIIAVGAAAVALKAMWDANFGGIQQTLAAAMPGIIQSFQTLQTAFGQLMNGDWMAALTTIGAAFAQFGAAIAPIFQGLWQAIAPILQGIGQAILDQTTTWALALWQWIVDATPGAVQALGDFANAAVAWIAANAEPFARALLAWGQAFLGWVGPMIPPVLAELAQLSMTVIQWLAQQIPPLTQALTKWSVIFIGWIITDVIPQIPGALATLGEVLVAGITALVPVLAQFGVDMSAAIWNGLIGGLQVVAPGLADWLTGLVASLQSGWESLVAGVQAAVAAVQAAWAALPAQAQAIWDAIVAAWNGAIATIQGAVTGAWAAIVGAITAAMAAIQAVIDAAWAAILAAWNAAGAALQAAVMAVWNALGPDVQQSLQALVTAVSGLWNALQMLTTTVWAAIQAAIQTALTTIQGVITTTLTTIQSTWTAALTAIQTWNATWTATVVAAWTTFTAAVVQIWTDLSTEATTIWTTMTQAIQKILDDWWATAKTWWDAVSKAISDVWTALSTTIGPIVKAVMDAITAQFDSWYTTAQQWLTKWTDLGTSLASALMDTLLKIVQERIKSVVDSITAGVNQITNIINMISGNGGRSAAGVGIDVSGSLQQTAASAAQKYNLPANKFLAQLQQESGFNPNALSPKGARGVAQFMPDTGNSIAAQMGVDSAKFWADTNLQIEGAAFHMRQLMDLYNDYDKALAAYNAGQSAVDKYGGVPPYAETQNYVRSINSMAANVQVPAVTSMSSSGSGSNAAGISGSEFQRTQQEWAKNAADANAICGPRLASLFADAVGRPPTPEEARQIGESVGIYHGRGIESAAGYADYATKVIQTMNPGTSMRVAGSPIGATSIAQATQIGQQSLASGSPLVGFNTANHYFGATQFDPESGKFNVGGTGLSLGGGNHKEWMSVQEMVQAEGALNQVLTLVGQTGDAFAGMEQKADAATTTAATGVQTDATATQTLQPAVDAAAQAQATYAATLSGQVVPAGAAAGNSLQQMMGAVTPLLAGIASGTMTTDQLVQALTTLAAQSQLSAEPLVGLATGSTTTQQAMQGLFDLAGAMDPQFAALGTQMQTTGADAQTMAVTFAEGLANGTGVATAAIGQMASSIDPLVQQVAAGSQEGSALEQTLVQLASSTGLTTAPFRDLQNGVTDSNTALKEVIKQAAGVSPQFADLAKEVDASGTVSRESALQFLQLVAAYKQSAAPADQAAKGAEQVAQNLQDASVPIGQLTNDVTTQATASAQALQTILPDGVKQAIDAVHNLTGDAQSAGQDVGRAISDGMTSGIQDAAGKVADAAAKTVRDAIDAAKSEAHASSPSKETMELGRNMAEGLAIGQEQSGGKAVDAAVSVTGQAIGGMRTRAKAHSPSDETRALGWHMNEGLQLGQNEDAQYPIKAGRDVIAEVLNGMADEAQAHSPSEKAVRIGKDIMKGLEKGLRSSKTSDIAKEQIHDYIAVAANFSDQFAGQVGIGVSKLQHQIAAEENGILTYTLAVKDAQKAIEVASKGTLQQQSDIASLNFAQATVQKQMADEAMKDRNVQLALRDAQQAQQDLQKGTLEIQQQQAMLSQEQANNAKAEADEALRSLKVRQQLAATQAAQETAQKGSLADQLRQADIATRQATLTAQQAAAERDMLPLRNTARDIQKQIQDATTGTLAAQKAAVQLEADQAAKRIEQLQIQDKLALGADTGGGMSQDQINALHARDRELQQQSDSAGRQAEIAKLQTTINTAPAKQQLLDVQDQISQREQALQPVLDEKAALDAESKVIQANNDATAAGYNTQIVLLQNEVTQHDAISTQLANQKAILDAQQAVIQATNDANAAAMNLQIVNLQAQVDAVSTRKQQEQDTLDLFKMQQDVINTTTALEGARLAGNLITQQAILDAQSGQLDAMNRQLEVAQATQNVIQTQVQLANALKQALTDAGVISDPNASSSSKSSKKKKKKASGGAVSMDDIVLVGEMGREIFVPPYDGYILNNATTERLMSAVGMVAPRMDSTMRARQTGGSVWGGRKYMAGEGGVEGFTRWAPRGGVPMAQPTKIVQATVHYHVHEQQRSGEARVERVVYEAVQMAANS